MKIEQDNIDKKQMTEKLNLKIKNRKFYIYTNTHINIDFQLLFTYLHCKQ